MQHCLIHEDKICVPKIVHIKCNHFISRWCFFPRGVVNNSMQARLFSMLLPALVVDGPVVVGGELPNKRQGAKFTCSSVSLI